MGQTKSLVLLAGAALSLSATAAFAQNNSDQVRSIVAEAMSDAETRSSLLAAGDAGHDGRFFISGDGYRLNIYGLLQIRNVADFRDDGNTANVNSATSNDTQRGFQIRRAKIGFSGDVQKDWFFNIRTTWDTINDNSGAAIDYAFAGYKFANGARFTAGQFKLPLLREELVSDSKQLSAERSVSNDAFTQGYSQGIALDYEAEAWRLSGAFSDGLNSANTDFTDNEVYTVIDPANPAQGQPFVNSGEAEYAFTARFEYMFAGNWKMFEDFTSEKGQDFGCLLGVAGHFQQSTNTTNIDADDRQTGEFTGDVSIEGDSWNVFAAYIGKFSQYRNAGNDQDLYDQAFIVQGGWRFAEKTELFARFDSLIADSDRFANGTDTFNFLTFGLNQYWAGHAAKSTIDLIYSLDDTENLVNVGFLPNTGQGLLGDSEDGEVVLRLQLQLLF